MQLVGKPRGNYIVSSTNVHWSGATEPNYYDGPVNDCLP